MTPVLRAVATAFLLLATPAANALAQEVAGSREAYPVDDSGTVVMDPVLAMQWNPAGGSGHPGLVAASTRVSAQLNLAEWLGRSGRIYMTLPRTAGPAVRASWTTGGTLLPGAMISGERALVYAGTLSSPLLRDVIEIRLEADGARLERPERLAFGFEIEVD